MRKRTLSPVTCTPSLGACRITTEEDSQPASSVIKQKAKTTRKDFMTFPQKNRITASAEHLHWMPSPY
jgi:hypothetical protein